MIQAFHHIAAREIVDDGSPAGRADRRAVAIARDDADAQATVADLIDRLGLDVVDLGPLAEGWRVQRGTPGYVVRSDRAALEQAAASAERQRDV